MSFTIISAGAGSGKTYRLTQEMVKKLKEGYPASGIIATTFTQKAASELYSRVSVALLTSGMREEAEALSNALIGTVHSLGIKLLQRFAFEAGVSPLVNIIAEGEPQYYFNLAMTSVLTMEKVEKMEALSRRLSILKDDSTDKDWRNIIKDLTDIARSNNFSGEVLNASAEKSIRSQLNLLDAPVLSAEEMDQMLLKHLNETLHALNQNGDNTKTTEETIEKIKKVKQILDNGSLLNWDEWARLSKIEVAVKSKEAVKALKEFAASHVQHPRFHEDITDFIREIFELSKQAIQEYNHFKTQRGLIDYTDMEVKVDELLNHPKVCEILKPEISILMVDEFQDTSPIQLSIFLKLSKIAKHTIWVGDPKQSIYGFRGAEPSLMKAIIANNGGIKPEDIQGNSYRSRKDLVHAVNAIFVRGFDEMPKEQVALQPIRSKDSEPDSLFNRALHWWDLKKNATQEGKPRYTKEWGIKALAHTLKHQLNEGIFVEDELHGELRRAQAGDVAILCRTNATCLSVATALKAAGLKVALSQPGIFETIEGTLLLACLKYIQSFDEIALTEILRLSEKMDLSDLLDKRLERQLKKFEEENVPLNPGGNDFKVSEKLQEIRKNRKYLSVFELLDMVISTLDLKNSVIAWGSPEQRLENIDQIRSIALTYEESCKSLHMATSLSGFISWCHRKMNKKADSQGAGEHPDAVRILTYHKSKGLEWPIVVLLDLDKELNTRVNGLSIVPENDTIDLSNILGNRWVRLWINPYGKNNKKTVLWENIEKSPEWAHQNKQDLAEEIRIFYVGFTRARDYLIFPQVEKKFSVIHRIWNNHTDGENILESNTDDPFIPWNAELVPIKKSVFYYDNDFPEVNHSNDPFWYTAPAKGIIDHKEKRLRNEDFTNVNNIVPTFQIKEQIYLWEKLSIHPWPSENRNEIQEAIIQYLMEWHPDEESFKLDILAEDICKTRSLSELLNESFFFQFNKNLTEIFERFEFEFIEKDYEIFDEIAQREYSFSVPIVVESQNGYKFIHLIKDSNDRELEEVLNENKLRLAFENELIKKNRMTGHIQNWILFIPDGLLCRMEWQLNGSLEEMINNL
jgi:ATP-dependent exoDNAse (exonuclease V) beta subunit